MFITGGAATTMRLRLGAGGDAVKQGHGQDGARRVSEDADADGGTPRETSASSATGTTVKAFVNWLAVTEICDDDYRSFCWPCHALEEDVGGKEGRE